MLLTDGQTNKQTCADRQTDRDAGKNIILPPETWAIINTQYFNRVTGLWSYAKVSCHIQYTIIVHMSL